MTLEQNIRFLNYWTMFTVVVGVLYLVPPLSPSNLFLLRNLLYFVFIDIFHGLVVPLTMELPQEDKLKEGLPYFYVRPPSMEPRREKFILSPVQQVIKTTLSLNSEREVIEFQTSENIKEEISSKNLSKEDKKDAHQNQAPPLIQSQMSLLMPWSIHPFTGSSQSSLSSHIPPSRLPPSSPPSSSLPPSRSPCLLLRPSHLPPSLPLTSLNLPIQVSTNMQTILYCSRHYRV